MTAKTSWTTNTIQLTVRGLRSYFAYYDIDIIPQKFKNKVTLPSNRKEDEQPLDLEDVRKILLGISNRRLKAYCFIMATGGPRAVEALAIRHKDIDFSARPTKIYMQAKYSKNKLPREIYITDEATEYLKHWLDFKYDGKQPEPGDLIFAVLKQSTPRGMYRNVEDQFQQVLNTIGMGQRKEGQKRHVITLHSFRRFAKTVIEDQTSHSYSEYILGHKKSVYYGKKEPERRQLYIDRCMRHLTFLDYSSLQSMGKAQEAKTEAVAEELAMVKKRLDEYENPEVINFNKGTRRFLVDFAEMVAKNPKIIDEFKALSEEINKKSGI
jgi:integrase